MTDEAKPDERAAKTLLGAHWIAGERSRSASGEAFHGVDPRSGARLDPAYHDAGAPELERAVTAAASVASSFSVARGRRAELLEALAVELAALGDVLLDRCERETALPRERLAAERDQAARQLRMFAGVVRDGGYLDARIDHGDPSRTPAPRPDVRRMLQPLGPVAVFGASSFPLAFSVLGGDTASALAAGCPVIFKGHPAHPGTAELTARAVASAIDKVGVEPGVFSLLHGRGHELGARLVQHPRVRAVSFTGSLSGGRALFDLAAARPEPIPVFAEMGSVNPVFVLPGAMRARSAEIATRLGQAVSLGVGQYCTNPGLVFVVGEEGLEEFTAALARTLSQQPVGIMLHERVWIDYIQRVALHRQLAGITMIAGGPAVPYPTTGSCSVKPVGLLTDLETFDSAPRLLEEVFGPVTVVIKCPDLATLERIAAGLPGQLTSTIHAEPEEVEGAAGLARALSDRSGRVLFNGVPTDVEVCHAMQHGGPYPATTDARATSIGTAAIARFLRPVCYQDFPPALLPVELRDENPGGLARVVDGRRTGAA
ncbi:MAG: aldehyde dehydrogenase (NADP(+)) [Myxococcales bacterium]|nr:aldehyde dehydrogenase (NADP(+)) [Myxococcales bacterium]